MVREFGHIAGVKVGQHFDSRASLNEAGVHKPLQAGISGSQSEGADSIVLSGGYEDDEDFGDVIIYTGHGGRDNSSGKQIKDQTLDRQNMALAKSQLFGLPVRVIRGHSHISDFSPISGYRYDGLFRVESHWQERGKSGFKVWRFRLVEDYAGQKAIKENGPEYHVPSRSKVTTLRVVRDTSISKKVKKLYDFHCQVCNLRIEGPGGYYAEASHIQPLGSPHNGPDVEANILCLCPNHHVMFDIGVFSIAENFSLIGIEGQLIVMKRHLLDIAFFKYHRDLFGFD